ncbi:MAG: CARDB domain-containing protein [Aggregatilineales bacterium]
MSRLWLLMSSLVLIICLSACNLGAEPAPEEIVSTSEPTPEPTGKPVVTITSPREGDEFAADEQILISVTATDVAGVTGIQLIANGTVVKSVSSPTVGGDREYPAVLDFTPRDTGEIRMQVIAFRGATASDPAELTVNVVETTVTDNNNSGSSGSDNSGSGTTGGNTGPVRPNIPNDGVCRVLVLTNLNFRSTPTTALDDANIISVLPTYTLAQNIARLPDNSWWKIFVGNQQGWVSGNTRFTERSGNCNSIPSENPLLTPTPNPIATFTPNVVATFTPTVTHTAIPQLPDLLVTRISGEVSLTIPADEDNITEMYGISVTNLGAGAATAFDVIVTLNGDDIQSFGVSSLSATQTIALSVEIPFTEAGEYDLRVSVDPDDNVEEVSDVNNRGDLTITVTDAADE